MILGDNMLKIEDFTFYTKNSQEINTRGKTGNGLNDCQCRFPYFFV